MCVMEPPVENIPDLSVVQAVPSSTLPVFRSTPDVSPPSGLAPMDQCLPWRVSLPVEETADYPLLPAPLTPRRMVEGQFVPGSVVTSPTGETDVVGGHPSMPDLPFDVHQDRSASGASPQVLDDMRGCQYRMTSYDEENGGPDFSPAYGIQLHDPRLLEYVGAPESAGVMASPLRTLEDVCDRALASARGPHLVERAGVAAVRDFAQQDVVRGHACLLRSGAVSCGCDVAGGAVVPYSSGGALHGGHGIVAAT